MSLYSHELNGVRAAFVSCVEGIVKIDGIMNSEKYNQIAVPFGKHIIGNNFVFQCSSGSRHTANA